MKKDGDRPCGGKKRGEKQRSNTQWVIRVFFLAVSLSAALSLLSSVTLSGAGLPLALLTLSAFILLGILFDIIGVSATAADPRPFHSMASHRMKGAREALWVLRNAEKVASFCNDVVGDICGIVSGSTAAVIVLRLQQGFSLPSVPVSIAVTAVISGLTIGGKAAGKRFAITKSKQVVSAVGRVLRLFHLCGR